MRRLWTVLAILSCLGLTTANNLALCKVTLIPPPAIGLSVPAWLSDYSNGQMLASNANFVRWMHTAPWKQDVESLDRLGLMQAMPTGDSEADVTGRRWEQRGVWATIVLMWRLRWRYWRGESAARLAEAYR